MAEGRGRFAKVRSGQYRIAVVELRLDLGEPAAVEFACSGQGFTLQGSVEEVPAEGYDTWKAGAASGARFALGLICVAAARITVTRIEGMSTDTSPATVGAAAALAVFNAAGRAAPAWLESRLTDMVFAGGLDGDFEPVEAA